MINKRDINKLRTPEDLERKYNLNDILTLKENYELQKNGLNKVENELNGFVIATGKNLKELQDQVDGNITTWFYSGVPADSNEPAKDWTTDTEKNNHLGDLYYDKNTGYAYRYSLDNDVYSWIKITDTDVTQALAIANSAKDTADSKRRVFVVEPTTPYDCGDLWLKDEELYRCQTTKAKGETFEENDWIIATKYTDDTKANQVGENLTILSGTVTEIRKDVDKLDTTMTNTTKIVDEQGKEIGTLQTKQSSLTQTVEGVEINVSNVSKQVETIEKTVSKYQTELDIYNITIPVDENKKPLENKDYLVGYKTTFEGTEVSSIISSQSENTGITFGLSNNKITLSVLTSTAITNVNNEFVIDFSYTKSAATYTDSKKIVVTLALKGATGAKGEQGEQGIQGIQGEKGETGSQGEKGEKGDKGDTGASGKDGTNGSNGKDGTNGTDGKNSYLHIKYSNDGTTFTSNDGNDVGRYIGSYTDYNETASTTFDDYAWQDTAIVVDEEINGLQSQINDTNESLNNNINQTNQTSDKVLELNKSVSDVDSNVKDVQKNLETANGKIETLTGVVKEMSFNFATDGMHIANKSDPNNSLLDNEGIRVYNYEKLNAIFNNKGSGIDKLIVTGTAQISYLKFVKSTKNNNKVTKIYHLKELIEDLEDLEV